MRQSLGGNAARSDDAAYEALNRRALTLYPDIPYHNRKHALNVWSDMQAIQKAGEGRGPKMPDDRILKLAAYWHDAGMHHAYTEKDFKTAEQYSAELARNAIILSAVDDPHAIALRVKHMILCTDLETRDRMAFPGGVLLHQADIANMSAPYGAFLDVNKRLYQEVYPGDDRYTHWHEWKSRSATLVDGLAPEIESELSFLGVRSAFKRSQQARKNAQMLFVQRAPAKDRLV